MDNQFKAVNKSSGRPFKTPEQIAATDEQATGTPIVNETYSEQPNINTMAKHKKKHKFWPPSKKAWAAIAVVLVLIAGGSYYYLKIHKAVVADSGPFIKATVPKPDTVASSLTGLQVSPATNKLPITAVMVENSTDARPQSGLGEAGAVFEAVAEGGITRFVVLYQSNSSNLIGPVRSARPYFISWMLGFDADYAHVGGSPEGEADIAAWGVKDMDQFYNGSYYQRISSRPAPHNVYTSTAELYQLEQSKGYTTSTFTSWPRKAASPLKIPTATSINLSPSGVSDYNVSYTYDSSTNTYNRFNGGAAFTDADTNKQISVPVVIAIVVQESNGPLDTSGAYYSEYQTTGSGTAYVFQDGGVTVGQWSKSSNNSQILFTSTNNQPIALNPGEVWITAVTEDSAVSYAK